MTAQADLLIYFQEDEDDLLLRLGMLLLGDGLGVAPSDEGRRRRFASTWLDERGGELRKLLCGPATKTLLESGVADRMTEAAVVADALAAAYGHATATVVAVILVRRGLAALCGE
jgi:hypothetical protein